MFPFSDEGLALMIADLVFNDNCHGSGPVYPAAIAWPTVRHGDVTARRGEWRQRQPCTLSVYLRKGWVLTRVGFWGGGGVNVRENEMMFHKQDSLRLLLRRQHMRSSKKIVWQTLYSLIKLWNTQNLSWFSRYPIQNYLIRQTLKIWNIYTFVLKRYANSKHFQW